MSKHKKHGKSEEVADLAPPSVGRIDRATYEAELAKLHAELVRLQFWVKETGERIVVIFEGRDAAGKGGVIKSISERVSPRTFRVVALPAPTEREKTQIYMQRYIEHLPAAGEIVLFDRSWYNRVGVEKVMGFCTEQQYLDALQNLPMIEEWLVRSGIRLIKYWFEISQEEQTARFTARMTDGRKLWKLSPMDIESHSRWYEYSRARDRMFEATDTHWAPWYSVPSDDKRRARLNCIHHMLGLIPYKQVKLPKIKLPARDKPNNYRQTNHPVRVVPSHY
jgi:polyphosphate kinase 2